MVSEKRTRAGDRDFQRGNERWRPGSGGDCALADADLWLALDLHRHGPDRVCLAGFVACFLSPAGAALTFVACRARVHSQRSGRSARKSSVEKFAAVSTNVGV